jgi:Anti-sigma factor NepR
VRQQTQERRAIASRLREALRHVFDSVATEPLPERWIDLINRLNEEECKEAEAKQAADTALSGDRRGGAAASVLISLSPSAASRSETPAACKSCSGVSK